MKRCVQKWHDHARQHFDWEDERNAKTEWDEFYGIRIMRERDEFYGKVDGFNDEAYAAIDLGLLWGANANSMPALCWTLIDTVLRPNLLSQVLDQIALSTSNNSTPHDLSPSSLMSNPLSQSIYAEELRLRFGFLVTRTPLYNNFQINGYKFPKGETVLASAWHEHRDRKVWNEGPVNGEFHSVDDFWAERFLVFPDDPASGPRKPSTEALDASTNRKTAPSDASSEPNAPKFTTDSVAGSYFPYGGGAKMCPGRFFAKQEIIVGMALWLSTFEIELIRGENDPFPDVDMSFYPFGVLPAKGKIPAKIRRRKASVLGR